jgi:dihydrofolate reductase
MGATTYEWVLEHEHGKWPYELPCWVFTHRDLPVAGERIELTADEVTAVHERMRAAAGGRNLWIVGGGALAGQFVERGLLDEVIVYIAPVTLGTGAPLLPRHVELNLEELARNGDFACARYSVAR